MNLLQIICSGLAVTLFSGCASMSGAKGPGGPRLVGGGHTTEYGQYAEVGIEFSSVGDFVAFVSPSRWKSPMKTGGSLSWMNPVAWSDDAGRTGRILLGEAVVVGGVAIAAAGGGGGGGDSGTSASGTSDPGTGGPTTSNPGAPPTNPL